MEVVAPHAAEPRADARHRVQQLQAVGVMVCGGVDEGEFDVLQQMIVGGDARASTLDTLVHGRLRNALGHTWAVGFGGKLFATGRQVVLAVGMLAVRQELGAVVRQRPAAPQQVAGRAPLSWIDLGVRQHAAA
jgi:hypothetical protein